MKYDKQTLNRMKRIEGQIKGVLRMMEEEKDCKEVVTQLSAIRSALDRTSAVIVAKNLEQCIIEGQAAGESTENLINEAVSLLVKSR